MLDDPEDEISVERAAELLGISTQIVHQRMDSGKLSFRQVGMHRKVLLADVLALKPLEDRRRSFASDLSADEQTALFFGNARRIYRLDELSSAGLLSA